MMLVVKWVKTDCSWLLVRRACYIEMLPHMMAFKTSVVLMFFVNRVLELFPDIRTSGMNVSKLWVENGIISVRNRQEKRYLIDDRLRDLCKSHYITWKDLKCCTNGHMTLKNWTGTISIEKATNYFHCWAIMIAGHRDVEINSSFMLKVSLERWNRLRKIRSTWMWCLKRSSLSILYSVV